MGWCKSPLLFCTASETACDIAQELADQDKPLPHHPLEQFCMPDSSQVPKLAEKEVQNLICLLEVYMDDFIGMFHVPTQTELEHFMWAVLHSIHKVFPPPGPMENQEDEPIALKNYGKETDVGPPGKKFLDGSSTGLHNACHYLSKKSKRS